MRPMPTRRRTVIAPLDDERRQAPTDRSREVRQIGLYQGRCAVSLLMRGRRPAQALQGEREGIA